MTAQKEFANYSSDNVTFTFRGVTVTAFFSGTFIEGERKEDGFTMHEGATGSVTRAANPGKTGTVTITVMAQSADNDALQAIADRDEQFRDGFGPLQCLDHSGGGELHASIAWIRKLPKWERAKEPGQTQWVFDCADLEIKAKGNVNNVRF
jgi:hypothetical protein